MLLAVVVSLGAVLGGCVSCRQTKAGNKLFVGEPIHFVIPKGFKGEIRIVENKLTGIVPVLEKGRRVIHVPPNGFLEVSSLDLFERLHEEIAVFEDGVVIPSSLDENQALQENGIRFFGIGYSIGGKYSQKTLVYFVGRQNELHLLK